MFECFSIALYDKELFHVENVGTSKLSMIVTFFVTFFYSEKTGSWLSVKKFEDSPE